MKIKFALLTAILLSIVFTKSALSGTYREDFDVKNLGDLWIVIIAGKASYEIKNGHMIQTSPGVSDGINLCYSMPLKGDIMFEVKVDGSALIDEASSGFGHVGFFDAMFEPMLNTDMHPHWMEVFLL